MKITVYTDGSCAGNPGVGGYCAILQCNGSERIVRGNVPEITTNNKMELKAVIAAIDWLNTIQKTPCEIEVNTDSKYIIDCSSHKTRKWFEGRANEDLWFELIDKGLKGKHRIKFIKVKAHSGDALNCRADAIAKEECVKAKYELLKGEK